MIDYSYMELIAKPTTSNFNSKSLEDLKHAMYRSQISTFGWPIALVTFNPDSEPRAITGGIEAKIASLGHRDYWILKRTGEFYFNGELFENNRNPDYIFIDTRTNRITESFLRVGALYSLLGVPATEVISFLVKHGNIQGKVLGAANSARIFPTRRVSNVNEAKTEFQLPLSDMTDLTKLKENVHLAVRDLAEMFQMFNPDKASFTDPIVEAYTNGKII